MAIIRRNRVDFLVLLRDPVLDEVDVHVVLPFDEDRPPPLEVVPLAEDRDAIDGHLYLVGDAGRVHAAGDVDSVAPDVVVQFVRADNAGRHVAEIVADPGDPGIKN